MFFIRPNPRKWYIPYGKVVCYQCARNKPHQMTEYAGPLRCGLCDKPKHPDSFLVYIISEKPEIKRKMPLMQNIMFTEPNPAKILSGEKTMTARCWKRKPPRAGQLMTASTGYAANTRFALILIRKVWEWEVDLSGKGAEKDTGLSKQEIAEREGFGNTPRPKDSSLTDWDAFIEAYYSINATKFLDDDRRDYFIAFTLLQPYTKTPSCTGCEKVFPAEELNWTYSNSPICDKCFSESYDRRNRSPRAGYH